jgi:hypothetical protein
MFANEVEGGRELCEIFIDVGVKEQPGDYSKSEVNHLLV